MPRTFDGAYLIPWVHEYGPLPSDYLTLDTETSGLDAQRDKIVQIGWCRVANGKAVENGHLVVDWTAGASPLEVSNLAADLEHVRSRMARRGNQYPWTIDLLRKRGRPPAEVAAALAAKFAEVTGFVTHYGWMLDYPMIGAFMAGQGRRFDPPHHQLYDTGLLVKMCLIGLTPVNGEPLRSFLLRLHQVISSPRHSLAACVSLFDLQAQGATTTACHEAAYDSWLVHLIFEALREYAPVPPAGP